MAARPSGEVLSEDDYRFILDVFTGTIASQAGSNVEGNPVGALGAYYRAVALADKRPDDEELVFLAESCATEAAIMEKIVRRLSIPC